MDYLTCRHCGTGGPLSWRDLCPDCEYELEAEHDEAERYEAHFEAMADDEWEAAKAEQDGAP